MKVLDFNKPKKVRSTETHNKMYSSDSGVEGTYVSNMSKEDQLKWKAKHITGKEERVEIRTREPTVNLLVIVYKNPARKKWSGEYYGDPYQIKMSMNGTSEWSLEMWDKLHKAVNEAKEVLGI